MLAAALSVALAGEAAVSVEGPAHPAHRQGEVDERQDVADALRLLLGAARREDDRIPRQAERSSGRHDVALRHAGHALDALGPVGRRVRAHGFEALGTIADVELVDEPLVNQDVQQALRQDRVGARHQGQVQRGLLRGRGAARVDDNQLSAGQALRLEVPA